MVEDFYVVALCITGFFLLCAAVLFVAMTKIYMNVSRHFGRKRKDECK